MKKIMITLILLCSIKAFAILPPFYHTTREIKTILDDPALHEKLGSAQMIQDIIKVDSGYVIITQDYFLQVAVEYQHSGKVGPGEFVLHFAEPVNKFASQE